MQIIAKLNPNLCRTKIYFDFLFANGYGIKCSSFIKFWGVILEGPSCLIYLLEDRSEILLSFVPKNGLQIEGKKFSIIDQISIQAMVYFLSEKEKFIGMYTEDFYKDLDSQFFLLSQLVRKYHEKIIPFFGDFDFYQNKDELYQASREYNNLLIERYVIQNQSREIFDKEHILEII